jgi:hypothetical protein
MEKSKRAKMPAIAISTLAGHGLCVLVLPWHMLCSGMFTDFFPALPWWRDMAGVIARYEIWAPYGWEESYRMDNWYTVVQLIQLMLAISLVFFVALLLRRKKASLVWLGITVLLELGLVAAVIGYCSVPWTADEIGFDLLRISIIYLPTFAIAPIVSCLGVKAIKAWVK